MKNNRVENKRISLSTPFLFKSKCKFCGGAPAIYYPIYNGTPFKSVNDKISKVNKNLSKYGRRFRNSWFMEFKPSMLTNISDFSHSTTYKGYNPRLFKNKQSANYKISYLMCECTRASWAFTDLTYEDKVEVINRKTLKNSPQVFKY